MTANELRRFTPKFRKTDGCWPWTASRNNRGYGCFAMDGRSKSAFAHRVAFEHWRTPIPPGMEVDHLCRTRHCVNPDHLELVTHQQNLLRSPRNQKLVCPHGHTLNNCYTINRKRVCRTCKSIATEKWRTLHPEQAKEINRRAMAKYRAKLLALSDPGQ